MNRRTESFQLRRGHHTLSIDCIVVGETARYVGSIDGRRCVSSITPEGALSALLRRIAYHASVAEHAA